VCDTTPIGVVASQAVPEGESAWGARFIIALLTAGHVRGIAVLRERGKTIVVIRIN